MINTRVHVQNNFQQDLVLIEIPGVSSSTTVREFMELVKAHPDVQAVCSPLLLLGATLFRKALRENGNPNAEITHHLRIGQSLSSLGIGDTKDQCFINAFECDPQKFDAWSHLGSALSGGKTVEVDGKPFATKQCYVKAITADPQNSDAWSKLGNALSGEETVDVAGEPYTQRQYFIKTIECDPQNAGGDAWFNLGCTVSSVCQTVEVAGKSHTKQQCFIKAFECDPQNSDAWFNLGSTLASQEAVVVVGETYTKQQCYIKAVEFKPHFFFRVVQSWPRPFR